MSYSFFSLTTVRFTVQRLRQYGVRVALRYLREDFHHNVIRRQPMWDHSLRTLLKQQEKSRG